MSPLLQRAPRAYDERDQSETRREIERQLEALAPQSGKYVPVVTSSGGGETVTYTSQEGKWARVGSIVWFSAAIVLATKSGGSGELRVSLPMRAASGLSPIAVQVDGHNTSWTGAPVALVSPSVSAVAIQEFSAGSVSAVWSKVGATGTIRVAGVYVGAT